MQQARKKGREILLTATVCAECSLGLVWVIQAAVRGFRYSRCVRVRACVAVLVYVDIVTLAPAVLIGLSGGDVHDGLHQLPAGLLFHP
jgi:hypothetical protein